jgi:phosphonatase-like hydrolase
MPQIKLVVFDMAGTTVADDGSIVLAFQQAMQTQGYQVDAIEINPLMGYKKPEAISLMLQKHEPNAARITDELISTIHDAFEQNMLDHYLYGPLLKALPYAESTFIALKKEGIRVGLNTGFSKAIAEAIVHRLGWLYHGLIDDVVASDEVPAGRPHPYMIRRLMERAGITDPLEVVKVGDTEVDVNEGRNAGCLYSVAVTTGAFTRLQLEPYHPDYIIDDLAELPALLGLNGL